MDKIEGWMDRRTDGCMPKWSYESELQLIQRWRSSLGVQLPFRGQLHPSP